MLNESSKDLKEAMDSRTQSAPAAWKGKLPVGRMFKRPGRQAVLATAFIQKETQHKSF